MGQFSRFLQGVVVAKDKSGAYVPKKYCSEEVYCKAAR